MLKQSIKGEEANQRLTREYGKSKVEIRNLNNSIDSLSLVGAIGSLRLLFGGGTRTSKEERGCYRAQHKMFYGHINLTFI